MAYICLKKPITLAGTTYFVGDEIPDKAVSSDREAALIYLGLIAKKQVNSGGLEQELSNELYSLLTICNRISNDKLPQISSEIAQAIEICEKKATEAIEAVALLNSLFVLSFLALLEDRKTVITAIEERTRLLTVDDDIEENNDTVVEENEATTEDHENEADEPDHSGEM